MEKQLRKYETTLINIGGGIILFAVWASLKVAMLTFSETNVFDSFQNDSVIASTIILIVASLFLIILLILVSFFQVYIGRSAIAEGRGEKKKNLYLWMAFIEAILALISIGSDGWMIIRLLQNAEVSESVLEIIVRSVVDITRLYMFIVLFVSVYQVRMLRKQLGKMV